MRSPSDHDPRDGSGTSGTNPSPATRRLDHDDARGLLTTSSLSPLESTSPAAAAVRSSNVFFPSRTFTLFPRLPPEIRALIWRQSIDSPRMHFVKLASSSMSKRCISLIRRSPQPWIEFGPNGAGETDEIAAEVQWEATRGNRMPKLMEASRLVPIAPDKRSDISSHHDLQQLLRTLAATCEESRAVVNSIVSRPGTLRLGDASILSTADSSDIFFLDYYPPELYASRSSLAIDPNCPELGMVRRVAVRFCHSWHKETASSACPVCRQVHRVESCRSNFPRHLYHLLARHFPSLEDFYFVDYLTLRKQQKGPREEEASGTTRRDPDGRLASPLIKCGNRTFFEANPDEWHIKPHVLIVRSWLADRFVRYAKTSRLSRHRNSDKVRFGILACEHAIAPPRSLQSKPKPEQTTSAECLSRLCKLRLKNDLTRRQGPRHPNRRTQSRKRRVLEPGPVLPGGVGAESSFSFGDHGSNDLFDFSFRLPTPKKGD